MLKDFAAIDFETANGELTSVCSVGIVIVKEGMIHDRIYSLIKPEPNYYTYWNSQVHGLSHKDTMQAKNFSAVWKEIAPQIENLPLVAHNSRFDEGCLRAVHKTYMMDYPDYPFFCTLKASRKKFPYLRNHKLNTVAAHCGYDLLNHHHALADAEACAWIALEVFQ